MNYSEHKPSEALDKYVKCYYTLEHDSNVVTEDFAFATGCIEVMFTLEGTPWQTQAGRAPGVELWGQILKPLAFKASGKSQIFGVRFYPGTAAFFLDDDVSLFNDQVFDLTAIVGNTITSLHADLQDAGSLTQRIDLVESYLLKKLAERPKVVTKIDLVRHVMTELTQKDFFDNISNVAERYGITSRYLQKVFLQQTGLTPKLYTKVNRFQNSLVLMDKKDLSLTSIAYSCGYFDQSHFIREFKSFTGISPSAFNTSGSTAVLASPNK